MASRIAGVLAVLGGVVWLVKFAVIWEGGGANTTHGLVGLLFAIGAGGILAAFVLWAWHLPARGLFRHKPIVLIAVGIAFLAAVNLPILLGWVVFGRVWIAEEVGVVLTAVSALVLGARWLTAGFGGTDRPAAP